MAVVRKRRRTVRAKRRLRQIGSPRCHQFAAAFEQICTPVRSLHTIVVDVRQGEFADLARHVRSLSAAQSRKLDRKPCDTAPMSSSRSSLERVLSLSTRPVSAGKTRSLLSAISRASPRTAPLPRSARDRDRSPQGPRPGSAGARCEAREPGPEGGHRPSEREPEKPSRGHSPSYAGEPTAPACPFDGPLRSKDARPATVTGDHPLCTLQLPYGPERTRS